MIGELIGRYGESSYGGNSHLIADEDEAWVVIEFSGAQKLWVAERLGPDDIRVSRPGYILEVPEDFEAREDFLGSPHLIRFAVERGWYDPSKGPFNVNAVYGDGKGRSASVVWMEDELTRRSDKAGKISLADMMWALRTERLTGDSAGYGQIVPLQPVDHDDVRLMWHAAIGPIAAPFTPFFLGVTSVPVEFARHRYLTTGEDAAFIDRDPASRRTQVGGGSTNRGVAVRGVRVQAAALPACRTPRDLLARGDAGVGGVGEGAGRRGS